MTRSLFGSIGCARDGTYDRFTPLCPPLHTGGVWFWMRALDLPNMKRMMSTPKFRFAVLFTALLSLGLILAACGGSSRIAAGNLGDSTALPTHTPTATDPFVVAWLLYGTPTPGGVPYLPADAGVEIGVVVEPTPTPEPVGVPVVTPTLASVAASGSGGDPQRGMQVFTGVGTCSACHDVKSGTTLVGPSLKGIASRAASRVPNLSAEAYIRESIVAPNKFVVSGFTAGLMPAQFESTLTKRQIDDVIAYLLTLQ